MAFAVLFSVGCGGTTPTRDGSDESASNDGTSAVDSDTGTDSPAETDATSSDASTDAPADTSTIDDAGTDSPSDGDGGCSLGSAMSAGTDQDLNLFGDIVYFANGSVLPAGHYTVTYLDGCMKYSSSQDWTIQAFADGHDAWWLVGDTTADKIVMPPGTVGYAVGNGGYATFDECVTANLALPPGAFDFAGGKIGVWLQDSPYSDNLAGENGRNPKWQLTYSGACVP